jgi:hypothetical protein
VHKKMTSKEIDAYTTPKALRRALLDRGIAQAVVEQFEDKPDELKRLRAHAKTLPGVCSEARSRGRIHVEGVHVEAQEIERISEFINNPSQSAKGAAYADTIQNVVNDVAQKASDVFSYVKDAVLGSTSASAPPAVADKDDEDEHGHGAATAQVNESSEEGKERERKEQLKKLRARARAARA